MKAHFLLPTAVGFRKAVVPRVLAIFTGLTLLLPVFSVRAAPAQAARLVEARLAALEAQPLKWSEPQLMQLSGVPVYVKPFSSSGPALGVAQSLAVDSDIFQRVLTAKNKIVLSGLKSDWHWLAEIEPATYGSKGYVSALYVEARQLSPAGSDGTARYNWLPAYARKQFELSLAIKSNTVVQHVYSVASSPQELAAYLDKSLSSDGWASEPAVTDMEGASAWRRKQARLMLFPHASAVGTSLFVHLVE